MARPEVPAAAHAGEIAWSGPEHPLIGELHAAKLAADDYSADHTGTAGTVESLTQMRSRFEAAITLVPFFNSPHDHGAHRTPTTPCHSCAAQAEWPRYVGATS